MMSDTAWWMTGSDHHQPRLLFGGACGRAALLSGGGLWEKRGRGYGACGVSGVCAGPFPHSRGAYAVRLLLRPVCAGKKSCSEALPPPHPVHLPTEIGRASCRERVEISGGAVAIKTRA